MISQLLIVSSLGLITIFSAFFYQDIPQEEINQRITD